MQPDANTSTNRFRQAAILARFGTLVVLVGMFVGTHTPIDVSTQFVHSDKMMHFWAYMTLAFTLATSWDLSTGRLHVAQYLAILFACAAYGVVDELSQIPVGRSCDAMDWLFDIAGAATGLLLFKLLRPLIYRVALLLPLPARS